MLYLFNPFFFGLYTNTHTHTFCNDKGTILELLSKLNLPAFFHWTAKLYGDMFEKYLKKKVRMPLSTQIYRAHKLWVHMMNLYGDICYHPSPLQLFLESLLSSCCFYPQGMVKTNILHCNSDPRSEVIGVGLANEVGYLFFPSGQRK